LEQEFEKTGCFAGSIIVHREQVNAILVDLCDVQYIEGGHLEVDFIAWVGLVSVDVLDDVMC